MMMNLELKMNINAKRRILHPGSWQYVKRKGIGVLITDHNVRETLSIIDRAYIINEGEIIASGLPNAVAQDEKVKQIYLGDQFSL